MMITDQVATAPCTDPAQVRPPTFETSRLNSEPAGGPRAEKLAHESDDFLLDQSIQTLSHLLQTSKPSLEGMLEAFYTHNWQNDRCSTGAYSYIPVGGIDATEALARPLDDTLFHQGTVHGAIATGLRAAREIITASRQS